MTELTNHVILKDKNMYYQAIVAFETGVIDNEGKPKVKAKFTRVKKKLYTDSAH